MSDNSKHNESSDSQYWGELDRLVCAMEDDVCYLRGGKYLLDMQRIERDQVSLTSEPLSGQVELTDGVVLKMITRMGHKPVRTEKLALALRIVFKRLGIQTEMIEAGSVVWLSNATLGRLLEWSQSDAIQKEMEGYDYYESGGIYMSKFALLLDQCLRSQERSWFK